MTAAPTVTGSSKFYKSSSPWTANGPAGVAVGDLLVGVVYAQSGATGTPSLTQPSTVTPTPLAFTLATGFPITFGALSMAVFYKYADSNDATTTDPYQWAWTGATTEVDGQLLDIKGGPISGNPFAGSNGLLTTSGSAVAVTTTPAVSLDTTSLVNPSLLLWFAGAAASMNTSPTSFTEIVADAGDNSRFASLAQTTAGSTGSLTGTQNSAADVITLLAVASPSAAPPGPATPGPSNFTRAAVQRASTW